MTSGDIRKTFLEFFEKKGHTIVPSAPMVIKNDPTLMFTNAGMNQFKDWFLGNEPAAYKRVANTQKCLRVSGKHNDLEEVGHDTYHHTMFEMLGNWSFGDYFKKEAIAWAWELLHQVFKLDADRLYATVFEGAEEEQLDPDEESRAIWERFLPPERIIPGNKKDNFWEMGETGPCGPCSEIHVDLRAPGDRAQVPGVYLVNTGHPLVVEIWNLVFIQFNRKADGTLAMLPQKHVDTGMGLERLCMAIQGKYSNYDTDLFQNLICAISRLCHKEYGKDKQVDIAMRVVADHLRAICFSIADGQLPSNVKAGYVIRRIIRRAVRYGYTFLEFDKPFLCDLVPALIKEMGEAFPELDRQRELIQNIIRQEEEAFLRALEKGVHLFDYFTQDKTLKEFSGKDAFLLYDTYGFPLDLTILMAKEKGLQVNIAEFEEELQAQKDRARKATQAKEGDWVEIRPFIQPVFLGYETTMAYARITRYRKVKSKNREFYQIVLDQTPFYAESGGQTGDKGYLENPQGEKIYITDTVKENNLILHIAAKAPENPETEFCAIVDQERRQAITNNHTATHLLHYALRQVLGLHIEQKGSHVSAEGLRFDFSHYARLEPEEIRNTERLVNRLIRDNITRQTLQDVPLDEARQMGAMALFGEKYGNKVRVIRFGDSVELCGGTHTSATGNIGIFKIVSEGAIAAGVRRIEAVTGLAVERKIEEMETILAGVRSMMNDHPDVITSLQKLIRENDELRKALEQNMRERAAALRKSLWEQRKDLNGIQFVSLRGIYMPEMVKDLAFSFRDTDHGNMAFAAAFEHNGKANLTLLLSPDLVEAGLNAAGIVRKASRHIGGGGGGQDFYATAGGKNPEGLQAALDTIADALKNP
ncbi:MAG: alanine--tRNA ligase [Bacteroidales bacterium]|jgi:alanyl-tRNA synthetase|nr:alanine--tRNA ligase [Bacteroidales bacterium]MDD2263623.1 alanine--tRNA ligase [Bacteroidales bacterium]MDD2830586.1 alanine--tRNA ligase [Bacteroidales bacterium]MDD3208855.1 alanine--tRNA ligase [Bacteroidales bacterium]MDD3697420.1 alanine--tRNA ligase [Bacteroidales bacterium]